MADEPFDAIEEALADIAAGRAVLVTDDEARENEGDLIVAATKATPEVIGMMIRHGSGIVCVPLVEEQLERLGLGPMVQRNRESFQTDFTVTVDAAEGVTTGISAADRARTIQLLADAGTEPSALVRPGHVFPLRARPGGVLERAGHTEAAVDLARLAGLPPAGVLCEVMNDDGSVARLPELTDFKRRHGLKLVSIAQLIDYRLQRERTVEEVVAQPFASAYGEFDLHVFRNTTDGAHHFALTKGALDGEPTLVRVHSENLLSDVFAAKGMRSGSDLARALGVIAREGRGVVVYMGQPCGGLALPTGPDDKQELRPAVMDFRAYGLGAQILASLGLKKIVLLSSTKRRVVALDGYGLEIVGQRPLD